MSKPLQLGALEIDVLDHLWASGASDAKAVHRQIGERRGITLNTVQSTLDRLNKKRILSREKVSHAFVYSPSLTKAEVSSLLIQGLMSGTLSHDKHTMLTSFVQLAEEADALGELERLIDEKKRNTRRRK